MKVYVDADACPKSAKEMLYKETKRQGVDLILVANQYLRIPTMQHVDIIVVGAGADIADDKIVELVVDGDLVITSDIPLADRVVKKNAYALSPRGELFDASTIGNRLAIRDILDELRSTGVKTGGPLAYSQKDKNNFANALNRFLTKHLKN